MKRLTTAALLGALALPVAAEEFTFAVTTDPQTMDPHAVNSAPVLGFLNNVYEGLVRRGKDMTIEPALADQLGNHRGRSWMAVQAARGRNVS